jgi:hypothetical protein
VHARALPCRPVLRLLRKPPPEAPTLSVSPNTRSDRCACAACAGVLVWWHWIGELEVAESFH